jgi:hypothetical protein
MYTTFYGLATKPFSLIPDPAFFFDAHQIESAYAILEYAVLQQEGVVVITGDAGCGKTTLVHHFLHNNNAAHTIGVISNPIVLKEMPLKGVLFAFDLPSPTDFEADLYVELQSFQTKSAMPSNASSRKAPVIASKQDWKKGRRNRAK